MLNEEGANKSLKLISCHQYQPLTFKYQTFDLATFEPFASIIIRTVHLWLVVGALNILHSHLSLFASLLVCGVKFSLTFCIPIHLSLFASVVDVVGALNYF